MRCMTAICPAGPPNASAATRSQTQNPSLTVGVQSELLDHGVEGAALASVAPEHAINVEGRRPEPVRHGGHFGCFNKEEHRQGIDEAADQPRAGNPVYLGPLACDPDGAALMV